MALTHSDPQRAVALTPATRSIPRSRPSTALVSNPRIWLGVVLTEVALVALLGWIAVMISIDIRTIDDTGLISVLPPAAYLCMGVLSASFVLALRMTPLMPAVLLAQVGALIVMLFGASAFYEEMPRFVTAWLHVGFADAIARTGELYPLRDARFDWPAFFILGAFLRSSAGLESLLPVLPWVPPIQMALYLGPLYLIARSATSDGRVVWLTLWFFCLMNWVGQDYFSPQGMNVLFYLSVLAILLTWFRRPPGIAGWYDPLVRRVRGLRRRRSVQAPVSALAAPAASWAISNREHIGLVALVALLFGASVASHQLTPFAMVGAIGLLAALGRVRLTGLPVLMIVLLVSWLMFRASTFLAGHLAGLLEDIGRPDQFAASNVAARLGGSAGHLLVLQARLGYTLGIWLLALFGILRSWRAGRADLAMIALAGAPFGLMMLQGYGGEMLLRIFLFSVPFMAYHAATALLPTARPQSWFTSAALIVISVAMATGLVLTRYGNEKADMVTALDYQAVQYAIEVASPGEVLASVNDAFPAGYAEWEQHSLFSLGEYFREGDIDALVNELDRRARPGSDGYLVLTRGQRAHAELFWGMTDAEWEERLAAIDEQLEVLYENGDAVVYHLERPDEEPST